tara:strand:- start:5487 stop:6422 length:936 start_codon:yes stop_codon:yes gene_type:complete
MGLTRRERKLILSANRLFEVASEVEIELPRVIERPELHVFDFDETLAFPPEAIYKLYLGYYMGKEHGFIAASPSIVKDALSILLAIGVEPIETLQEPNSEFGPTTVLHLDYKGYETAREKINSEFRNQVLGPSLPTKLKSGKWKKMVSVYYQFPEAHELSPELYQPLPATEIMKEKILAGHHVYICTARAGNENIENIMDFLKFNKIKIPKENIFAVGSENKSNTINRLIELHNTEDVFFYDDSSKNVLNVMDDCCSAAQKLTVIKYSRKTPGAIDSTTVCGIKTENKKRNNRYLSESRSVFRKWRKMSGI